MPECKPLCTESYYDAMVTYDLLNPAYVKNETAQFGYNLTQSEVTMVEVYYSMLSEKTISFSAYATIDFISSAGGILGLIFEGSCMTIVQFVTFHVWFSRQFMMSMKKRMREAEGSYEEDGNYEEDDNYEEDGNYEEDDNYEFDFQSRKSRMTIRDCFFV
ncbi:unnamed protein product [Darwinula stevensoni]|uniref:Uncharacterized protein n=1 Tax=Darwinula stevensoni TaxID=69355 RepID=A0A7R9AGX1_9CRUS|nr:unnamed protein product [Darwinula stevensoni]CAG0904669.1 unnamed protein product [Darwinula stevensoni]